MKLKTLMTAAVALITVGFLSMPADVEAKRFGGGMSLGKQYRTPARPAQPPTQAQRPAAGQTNPAAASGASRWLGPLAGLAAGGLLASLFFGDAFEGIQLMDILLIAGLIFGGVMLFRMLGRSRAGPARVATAGAPAGGAYARESSVAGTDPVLSGGLLPHGAGARAPLASGTEEFPSWFDGPAFIEGAKTHFIRLQAAWDQADLRDIREYTTPQLFAELQRERERLDGAQYTEVVRLEAELSGIQRDDDRVVASVLFSGLIREEEKGVAEAFREVWHVQHDWTSPEGDWQIAGIEQRES